MTKKLFLITFIFLSVKLFAETPILSNFRVEDSQNNLVYFDSSIPITASNAAGFTISGNTVSGVTINTGQITGHYFTVATQFTFFDNNTIRYEGGSDLKGSNSDSLLEFTLTYIVNNLVEPTIITEDLYVTHNASGGTGSISSPYTFQEAINNASAGTTIYVKAGEYDLEEIGIVNKNGTASNPIKIIGYTSTINDITDNILDTFDYVNTAGANAFITSAKYPVLTGNNTSTSGAYGGGYMNGFWIENSNFIIFKNIQIEKYYNNIWIYNSCDGLVFENMTLANAGREEIYNEGSNFFSGATTKASRLRFHKSVSFDAIGQNYRSYSSSSLIKDSKFYAGIVGSYSPVDHRATDYYISIFGGSNSITINNHCERVGLTLHGGHGIGIRTDSDSHHNLVVSNTLVNIGEGYMIGGPNTHHNVFKNNRIIGTLERIYPITMRDGTHDNIFENNYGEFINYAIYQWWTTEYGSSQDISINNTFRNNIFNDYWYGVVHSTVSGTNRAITNSHIYNNTFYGSSVASLFWNSANPATNDIVFTGCEFKNNIVHTALYDYIGYSVDADYVKDYNVFHNYTPATPAGTGNKQVDPQFEDTVKFMPQNVDLQVGIPLTGVDYDTYGEKRDNTNPTIGAVEKKNGNPISANAGPDITICNNPDGSASTTTLTATGLGSSFLWSTGETTASIDVSPSTTTTYTVTVSDGVNPDDSDDVIVTVNESPTVDLGSDQSICYGETVTLTATGTGDFLWNTGDTTASITVNPTTTTTYSITASNSCAIDATDDIIVNVNPEIGLTVGSDISICVGENTTLTATGNGDFLWNTGETTPSITVQPNSTTTYTVTSSLGTCTENANILVTVSEVPSVDLGSDQSICYGETVTLTATGTGDFLWNTGETTASITINPTTTTTYSATASNSCATDATDEIIINVNPEIGLTVGNDISICIGENTTLTAAGNGDFLWSTGETTPIITVQPNSTTTYSVSSSLGACTENASILVTVNTPPSVDLGSDQSICYGESVTLSATGTGNFLWNTGETTASITVNPTTTTTYNVTASNACSDDVTDDIIVNVNPEIGLTVGNDISICTGESTILTAAGNGDFLWNTGETTASITVQPNSNTTYTVTSSLGTCSESASVIVTISDSATVDLGPDKSICYGETVTLTATGSGNFLWNTGETTASITVNPTTSATYSVTASNSCSGDATDDITVNVNALPSVNAGEDITILNGESTTLTATGNGNFLWSTGEASPSITVNPTSTTSYSVVITSDQGCLNQDTVVVTVENTESIIADAGPDQNVCPDSSDTVLTASGGESYLWSTGETTASITVNPTVTTVYTVAVYVGNTHTLDEVTVYIDESCSDNISSVQQEFKLYPNPTHGILHIEMTGVNGDLSISLFNLSGTLVYSENLNNSSKAKVLKQKINLNKFAKGIYFVRLDSNGNRETKKIILI